MSNEGTGRLARAILFFAAVGGGIGAAIVLAVAAIALVLGDSLSLGEVLPPLGGAAGVGGLVGAAFASGVALLGRDGSSDHLARWKAGLAGALAGFVVPLVAMGVVLSATGNLHIPVLELIVSWTQDAWWLLGLGGGVGVGLNEVARRPQLIPSAGHELNTAALPASGDS